MATAKRLYLYIVSGVGLGLLLAATSVLGSLLLDQFGLGSRIVVSGPISDRATRESLAMAIGFVVVGLPLWLFHWALVERMVTGDGPAAAAERQSIVRAVYFAIVLLWLVAQAAASGTELLREAICRPLGAIDPYSSASISASGAWFVVALGAFAYHAWMRTRDLRRGPAITGAAAWLSRLSFYGFAFAALLAALVALGTVFADAVEALTGYAGQTPFSMDLSVSGGQWTYSATTPWWVRPIVGAAASALLYGIAWLGHWLYASRLGSRADQQGSDERASRVRLTYFVLVVVAAVSYTVAGVGSALGTALNYALGSWVSSPDSSVLRESLIPLLTVAALAVAGVLHHRRAARESHWVAGSALRAVRPMDYLTALIGLGTFSYALIALLSIIAAQIGATTSPFGDYVDSWRSSAAQAIAFMIAAAPFWLWPWVASQRRRRADTSGESRSTSRRAFLFTVGGATVLTAATAAAFIVYRISRVGVGLGASGLGSDVRLPLCALLVALPLLAYHVFWIRRDLAGAREPAEPAPAAVLPDPAMPPTQPMPLTAPAPSAQELVIVGPAGADLEALRASLSATLPEGYSATVRSSEGTTRP